MDFGKYTFKSTRGSEVIEFTVSGETGLTEMLEHFERFLKAAGYVFDGIVDIVDADGSDYPPDEDEPFEYCDGGSDFYVEQPRVSIDEATPAEWDAASRAAGWGEVPVAMYGEDGGDVKFTFTDPGYGVPTGFVPNLQQWNGVSPSVSQNYTVKMTEESIPYEKVKESFRNGF